LYREVVNHPASDLKVVKVLFPEKFTVVSRLVLTSLPNKTLGLILYLTNKVLVCTKEGLNAVGTGDEVAPIVHIRKVELIPDSTVTTHLAGSVVTGTAINSPDKTKPVSIPLLLGNTNVLKELLDTTGLSLAELH
jgi:hypothetical protein